jgi:hypothetical protein
MVSGFAPTLERRGIAPRSVQAIALAGAIRRLRAAARLPLDQNLLSTTGLSAPTP